MYHIAYVPLGLQGLIIRKVIMIMIITIDDNVTNDDYYNNDSSIHNYLDTIDYFHHVAVVGIVCVADDVVLVL